jgi:hypothetical protein
MKTIVVKERQTLFDIALQYCGDANAAFQIAAENDVSLSGVLPAGTELDVPEPTDTMSKRIVEYYALNNVSPATDDGSPNEINITTIDLENIVTINTSEIITVII